MQEIQGKTWQKILIFLKEEKSIYVGDEKNVANFINGVLWIARTGAQWREMPEKYGSWNSIFKRFNRWSMKGIWYKLYQYCQKEPDLEHLLIDSTIVRSHPCSAGARGGLSQALGRSKGGFSTKIHVITDALGNPLDFTLTPGQVHDIKEALPLLQDQFGEKMIGDRGYDCDYLINNIKDKGMEVVIPSKKNRKEKREYDKHTYKERHLIECLFNKVKYYRRIFSRFDKYARNFWSFICFVFALIWLK